MIIVAFIVSITAIIFHYDIICLDSFNMNNVLSIYGSSDNNLEVGLLCIKIGT